ncbi:TetR/AcrR family transcriptional regulator [Streptomyces sp. Je 1-4]|uniref:TetR/AcrR family transcriptional regulator n=1 Tax=Streptomyces TaxID=1883 RepID=UPI0021DB54D7|nr:MULTISPECIES: TetR/AcrR family transcriptional regulator [unclassified Streptomyces]UYB38916.1 TetR/AcrR family transcriptional regulator [Streptomyces sp. Je 1-4]UZQ34910.1 TetR/AcrR family transcriptional regulator [Streptomyces sp. Je 1-4] [Streptomyces sp. Je 1-4 4N24]UZQ42328.1 TetR/AcrR family transcriptional regulator [Streptomyces sp. Je 1-4] [Streptomyces sp. Je 1-4 4N24_ara]
MTTPHPPVRAYAGVGASERIAARRTKLIEAGLKLFTTRGYMATGGKDLCREAGLTDRYFYESFANREVLLLAVFDTVTEQLLDRIAQAAASAPQTSPEREQATVEAFVRELAADPRKACLIFIEVHGVNDVVRQHARVGFLRFVDLVAAVIRDILPPGTPETQLRMTALSVIGAMAQAVTAWHSKEVDIPTERLIEHCVQVFEALVRAGGSHS